MLTGPKAIPAMRSERTEQKAIPAKRYLNLCHFLFWGIIFLDIIVQKLTELSGNMISS